MARGSRPRGTSLAEWGVVYGVLTVLYAWPLVAQISTVLPHDSGDPGLNAWILWWNSQAVPFTERWWNAPIFHPGTGSLALSETLLSIALVTTPLQWLGASPATAYNIAFLLSIPSAGLGVHALVRYLTGRNDAALIAGLAFAFSPYRVSQMPHIQMQWSVWMPLCLFLLHRHVDSGARRYLAGAAVCWALNGFTSGYFFVYFAVLTACWMLWFIRTPRQFAMVGAALAVGSLPLVPMLMGHAHYQAVLGLARSPEEIAGFSADARALWSASRHLLARHWTLDPEAEGELYPGALVLGLMFAGAVVAWRRARVPNRRLRAVVTGLAAFLVVATFVFQTSGGWPFNALGIRLSVRRAPVVLALSAILLASLLLIDERVRSAWRRRATLVFYPVAAVLMLLFALGPEAHVFGAPFWSSAPYAWLMELPGGRSLRVPARFATMFILCVVVAAGLAWHTLMSGRARPVLAALAALAILVDGWVPNYPLAPLPQMVTLGSIPVRTPVLELPLQSLYSETAAQLRATAHGHPLVNGFSGYEPPHYAPLRASLQLGDTSGLTALQRLGPLVVLVNSNDDPTGSHTDFVAAVPGARQLYRTPVGRVFSLPGIAPNPAPRESTRLSVIGLVDRWGQDAIDIVTDGDFETRWQSDAPQFVGDTLQLRFDRRVIVSHLEVSLGSYILNYPRLLAVTADDGTLLWQGSTAGEAFLAALAAPKTVPLTVAIDRAVPTTTLTLTILEGDPAYPWSASEIRAFGRMD